MRRVGGATIVTGLVIGAFLALGAAARWIAGANWAEMLRDFLQ